MELGRPDIAAALRASYACCLSRAVAALAQQAAARLAGEQDTASQLVRYRLLCLLCQLSHDVSRSVGTVLRLASLKLMQCRLPPKPKTGFHALINALCWLLCTPQITPHPPMH